LQVIAAEGEQKASRALKEASEVIAQSSSALQLRYLQVTIWKNIQKLLFLKYGSFFSRHSTPYRQRRTLPLFSPSQ
jgi:hypothetical protein